MKKIYLLRHANWNGIDDTLTTDGEQRTAAAASTLPKFAAVYASPLVRTQQTAALLSGRQPQIDERAGIPKAPADLGPVIAEKRKTHPLGVAGVLFEIPAARPALQTAGDNLRELMQEILRELPQDQAALIVSHDGTMAAAEKVITGQPFDTPLDHSFDELEGLVIDENFAVQRLP